MVPELINITQLKKNPDNPRIIKDDKFAKLVQSIQQFPEMMKIRPIVYAADFVVLGGNMRLEAAKTAGLKEVWAIDASDLTPDQQREFIIKDNVGFGEWDWEELASNWDSDELEDWGLDIPGFDMGAGDKDPFDDEGIAEKNQFGVIVMCATEEGQSEIFTRLQGEGYTCKIVVV